MCSSDLYPINEFEKDYNKIVSSAAFRRLQDKTQVFPLDKSDFVRTRLTHSIEVSTIARQLGIMVTQDTSPYRPEDIGTVKAEAIPSVLRLHALEDSAAGILGDGTDFFAIGVKHEPRAVAIVHSPVTVLYPYDRSLALLPVIACLSWIALVAFITFLSGYREVVAVGISKP